MELTSQFEDQNDTKFENQNDYLTLVETNKQTNILSLDDTQRKNRFFCTKVDGAGENENRCN